MLFLLVVFTSVYAKERNTTSLTPFAGGLVFYDALGDTGIAACGPEVGLEVDHSLTQNWELGFRGFVSYVFPKGGMASISGGGAIVTKLNITDSISLQMNLGYPLGVGISIDNKVFCIDLFPQAELLYFQLSYGYTFHF